MDLSRIFLKDACPTSIGGQAVLEGVMMRGADRTAVTLRLPDGRMYLKTMKNRAAGRWARLPLIRGVVSFLSSLVTGTRIITFSADALDYFSGETAEEPGKLEQKLTERFGEKKIWNAMIAVSVILALAFSIAVFILMPTAAMDLLGRFVHSTVLLNLAEGIFRIILFILYILLISKMEDIHRVFMYHGAEHKSIHTFENGLDLIPENARGFYTLHPRCGTSFLMFVMVISLVLFSLLGWPSLVERILSRLLLIPVVAALSYEVLRWAGRSDGALVKLLSLPGLYLQKLTTAEPTDDMVEVAMTSLKAVLVPAEEPCVEGICDADARIIEEVKIDRTSKRAMDA